MNIYLFTFNKFCIYKLLTMTIRIKYCTTKFAFQYISFTDFLMFSCIHRNHPKLIMQIRYILPIFSTLFYCHGSNSLDPDCNSSESDFLDLITIRLSDFNLLDSNVCWYSRSAPEDFWTVSYEPMRLGTLLIDTRRSLLG